MISRQIYGWDGFELSSDELTLGITPSIGGRIMSLVYKGQEILFVDPQHTGELFNPTQWQDLSQAKKELGFRVWGGDKTWIAPQSQWLLGIPPLDLDAAPYSIQFDKATAIMTSPVCRETGLQIIRRVSLTDNNVFITEELHNKGTNPIERGLWNVTQIKRPCSFEIPSKIAAFRSYHHEDPTLPAYKGDLTPKEGVLVVLCNDPSLFKIGGMPSKGEVLMRIPSTQGDILWTKFFELKQQQSYAHNSAVEIFNSPDQPYAEIELHAPLKNLLPGESISLEQVWYINN